MLLLTDPIKQLKVPLSSADGEQISVCAFLQISQTAMGSGVTQGRWLNPISTCGKTRRRYGFVPSKRNRNEIIRISRPPISISSAARNVTGSNGRSFCLKVVRREVWWRQKQETTASAIKAAPQVG